MPKSIKAKPTGIRDLPTELLLEIFDYLDSKEICTLSETCTLFKDIIDDSDQLVSKLTLFMKYPKQITSFGETMSKSTRPYKNMKISRFSKFDGEACSPSTAFRCIAPAIKNLEVNWSGYYSAISEALQTKMREANIEVERPFREMVFIQDDQGNGHAQYVRRPMLRIRIGHDHGHIGMDDDDDFPELQVHTNYRETAQTIHERGLIIQRLRAEVKAEFFKEFCDIMREFTGVENLCFSNIANFAFSSDFEPLENLSCVKELTIKRSDLNVCSMLLKPCVNLTSLFIIDPSNFATFITANQREAFDRFFISLENLKELSMKNVRNFFRESLPEIKFKLNTLTLHGVFFTNQEAADKFFFSQDQLKMIDLTLRNEFSHHQFLNNLVPGIRFDNILKNLLKNNKSLESITLFKDNCDIENSENFLKYIINPKVRNFVYHVSAEDKEVTLFKTLSRKFPNLERIEFNSKGGNSADACTCISDSQFFNQMRSLTIINSNVHALPNIFVNNLERFEYSPGHAGEFIDDYIGGFFHRHRGIKHLTIGTTTLSSLYFFVSYNLCQLIINFLSDLESVAIYNFAEINKSVKLLCTLPKLRSLTVAESQYEQFTKKTKDECEKRKLKLIPVKVEVPRVPLE